MPESESNGESAAQVLEAWCTAFNRSDLGAICALYEPEALLWGTSATAITCGASGVAAYFKAVFSVQPPPQMQVTECIARGQGDSAVLAGSYELKVLVQGKPHTVPARFMFALNRSATGWLIAAQHSSKLPTEPLIPEAGAEGGA
jgi:ketosteroid isomerase-like protein